MTATHLSPNAVPYTAGSTGAESTSLCLTAVIQAQAAKRADAVSRVVTTAEQSHSPASASQDPTTLGAARTEHRVQLTNRLHPLQQKLRPLILGWQAAQAAAAAGPDCSL